MQMEFPDIIVVKESSEENNLKNNTKKEVEIKNSTDGYQSLCQIDTILNNNLCMFAIKENSGQQNKEDTKEEIPTTEEMNAKNKEEIEREAHGKQMEAHINGNMHPVEENFINNMVNPAGQHEDLVPHMSHMTQEFCELKDTINKILEENATTNSYIRILIRVADHIHRLVCEDHSISCTTLNKNKDILELCKFLNDKFNGRSCVIKAKCNSILRGVRNKCSLIKEITNSESKHGM